VRVCESQIGQRDRHYEFVGILTVLFQSGLETLGYRRPISAGALQHEWPDDGRYFTGLPCTRKSMFWQTCARSERPPTHTEDATNSGIGSVVPE